MILGYTNLKFNYIIDLLKWQKYQLIYVKYITVKIGKENKDEFKENFSRN